VTRPVSTYAELLTEISKLETPRPGCVRVFRGQTKNYPTMLPSGFRKHIRNEAVWHSYAMVLGRDLLAAPDDKSHHLGARILTLGKKEALWINAVAQHYGPGSNFLDVTRSLDIALWFALHEAVPITSEYTLGPLGSEDPAPDIDLIERWTKYRKLDAGPGFLYVFDVPEFHGESFPPHGSLLDLSKAHRIFSESERIKAQAACLIAAERAVDGGDLKRFLACDPIEVWWPMNGAPQLHLPVEEMFPNPSQDKWYERFVSIPFTEQQADPTRSGLSLARPIEVTLYYYKARDKRDEITRRIKRVSPTRHVLSDTLTMDLVDEVSAAQIKFRLNEATHILLDAPIMSRLPAADSQMWNQGILGGDMSDSVEAFDVSTETRCGSVSLTNVYFEFSPLEVTGWEQLGKPNGKIEWLGGMWIVRKDAHVAVQLFPRWLGSSIEVQTVTQGFGYNYCAINGKFWRRAVAKQLWTVVVGDKPVDKAFFTALSVLRFLSPVKKADPFPLEEELRGNGNRQLTIPVREKVATLTRMLDWNSDCQWYVPRDVLSKDGLFLEPTAYLGTLSLESEVPWSGVDASGIRRDIAEQCGTS